MPHVSHLENVPIGCADVWRFVRNIDNWAANVPGYQEHVVVDADRSRWKVKGDLGVLSRVVELEVDVTDWREPKEVVFTLRGINEQVQGEGRFVTAAVAPGQTELGFHLDLQAGGRMGPMVNALMQPILPKMAGAFARNLARQLTERVAQS